MLPAKRIDYYPLSGQDLFGPGTRRSALDFSKSVKDFYGRFILSPLFLLFSLAVFLFLPREVLRGEMKLNLASLWQQALKRIIDILFSFLGIVFLFPIFPTVALLIKLDSRGPLIYKQVRIGQNRRARGRDRRRLSARTVRENRHSQRRKSDCFGRPFTMYKFRTMRVNAEKETGPIWAGESDPRVTRIGRILRRTRLDETPQLFNVLKDDMSFIGPRPERYFFIEKLRRDIPEYTKRLEIKPGLTGLAQVMYIYPSSLDDTRRKIQYDLLYLAKKSMVLDLRILLLTVGTVLRGNGVR